MNKDEKCEVIAESRHAYGQLGKSVFYLLNLLSVNAAKLNIKTFKKGSRTFRLMQLFYTKFI